MSWDSPSSSSNGTSFISCILSCYSSWYWLFYYCIICKAATSSELMFYWLSPRAGKKLFIITEAPYPGCLPLPRFVCFFCLGADVFLRTYWTAILVIYTVLRLLLEYISLAVRCRFLRSAEVERLPADLDLALGGYCWATYCCCISACCCSSSS